MYAHEPQPRGLRQPVQPSPDLTSFPSWTSISLTGPGAPLLVLREGESWIIGWATYTGCRRDACVWDGRHWAPQVSMFGNGCFDVRHIILEGPIKMTWVSFTPQVGCKVRGLILLPGSYHTHHVPGEPARVFPGCFFICTNSSRNSRNSSSVSVKVLQKWLHEK